MRLWKRPVSISVFIGIAVTVLLVPLLLFVVLLFTQFERFERRELALRAGDSARSLSFVVERRLADMATTLRLIATSAEVSSGDLEMLHQRTQRSLIGSDLFLLAVDRAGNQLLNTRVPFGSPLGKTSDAASLERALASNRVEVSSVFMGRTSGQWVYNVIYPLVGRANGGVAALILTQNAADLTGQIMMAALPAGWSSAVVDQGGHVVAVSTPTQGDLGAPFDTALSDFVSKPGSPPVISQAGERMLVGSASVTGWDWRVYVWGPERSALQNLRGAWDGMLAAGLALAVATAAISYLFARTLRRSILGLRAMAADISEGKVAPPPFTEISELDTVAKALSEASFDRSEAENKTIVVMRELAHRTKNLLAIVQSMVRQTAKQKQTVPELIAALGERLGGLAHSIDLLTASEWQGVPIRKLVDAHLAPFIPDPKRISLSGPDIAIRPEAVQPLGMAFHELATNAAKYGALSTLSGRIEIAWQRVGSGADETIRITWREVGGPPPKKNRSAGFGTTVVERHTESALEGQVDLQMPSTGLVWELTAPATRIEAQTGPAPV